ncbi:MAG: nrdD [Anaerospora sp.]|nr:nrdD [Anaerospora sp.]
MARCLSALLFMRNMMDNASEKYNLNYTLLATPAEGLSGRFIKMDRAEYGSIAGVTDKTFYTNSYHIPVNHAISAYDKIRVEGVYHKYCNAGHISYVEFTAPPVNNLGAVEDIIRFMKECDYGYAGINFPIDFCDGCGYLGVIDSDECPSCGTSSVRRIRRITGYLSTVERFNDAKTDELKQRVSHA